MNDLISRQAAVAHAISGLTRELEGEKWIRVSEVRESLQTMPSAERRGRWIDETFEPWGLVFHPYKCNQCGGHSETDSDFCPNCGAFMRGEEE